MVKQVSRFAAVRGGRSEAAVGDAGPTGPEPNLDDPRVMRAMNELEKDFAHMDENNPKHMAQMMRKMKDLMPPGSMPKEMDSAIKRLEAGEDPEKIEADMGEVFGDFVGDEEMAGPGGYTQDAGLYDY